jgi:hypothetical protein
MPEPQPPLEKILEDGKIFYEQASAALHTWYGNFTRNTQAGFANMSTKNWIRLVTIVCAYALLRPYLMKIGAHLQAKGLQEEGARMEEERAAMDANDLRRGVKVKIPGVDSSDDEEENREEWGRKARVRQRKIVKKAMEIHEERLTMIGNESDKDIEDLLED